jgi:antitoxin component YwqK of YwqJK toxin-antitoxin module
MRYILSFTSVLIIFSFFSQQNIALESQLTLKENKFYQRDQLFSGQVIYLFETGQQKSIVEIKDGLPNGKTIEFLYDKSFQKMNFKDSVEIRKSHKLMSEKKAEIESNIQDTLKASKEVKDFLNYEIGGVDKLVKLKEKNDEGKLNQKKKEQFDKYEGIVQAREQRIRKLNNSQNDLQSINQNLKTESSKNEYIPTKSKEYTIVNSTKEGAAIIYDSLGNKFGEGNYNNGKQDGEWVYYQGRGTLKGKGKFINGDGIDIGKSGVPKDGRDGLWIFYFENGNKESEGNYKDGILEGQRKIYFSNGKLKENGTYVNGKASGHFVFYHENGSVWNEVDYKEGKKMGLEIVYNEEGKKINESNYIDGVKNGKEILFDETGNKIQEYDLKNDIKNGIEKEYYSNGTLKAERNYKMGKNHGKTKTYYESGKIQIESETQNGKPHGLTISYFENGKINFKVTYDTTSLAEGNTIGDFFSYNEDGSIKLHGYAHKDGRVEDKTESNSNKSETNGSYSKTEMNKPYKCKCCKATINGLEEGVDNNGNDFSQLMFDFNAKAYYSLESSFKAFGFKDVYDYMRKQEYPFCSLKCFRACQE